MTNQDLYNKYDLLLPSKFDGGYLIIAIDEKIKAGDLDGCFTTREIEDILKDVSVRFQQESVPQWSRIKDNLLHYFIRNHPEEPGKYYLTDYAKGVLDMMRHKLENPYKKYPLKQNFESRFFLRFNEIKTIEDLELKLGRQFIEAPKKVIIDHLEGLEDELTEAYKILNNLLEQEAHEAVELVKSFALTFRKFGARAEDITDAMRSKDKFLKDLQMVVDTFYTAMNNAKFSEDKAASSKLVNDWERAHTIYEDIRDYFISIDQKINTARRQIYNASEKLSELQEYFSTRANYRLQIQKLLGIMLQTASYSEEAIVLREGFPLKPLVYEREKMLFLRHYEFASKKSNEVILITPDEQYEQEERGKIENEINRQKIINQWVNKAKEQIKENNELSLEELMHIIGEQEPDSSIAYRVASQMIAFVSENSEVQVDITRQLVTLQQNDLALWKTKIKI